MKTKKNCISWIAFRQLMNRKGRGLGTMTWVSMFGVAIGVAALIVVRSVMSGMAIDLKQRLFLGLPHLEVLAHNATVGFSLDEFPEDDIKKHLPGASGIEPFIQADVVVKNRRLISSVALFGVQPDLGGQLWGFGSSMIEGEIKDLAFEDKDGRPGIVLGEKLASRLSVHVDDVVTILNPQTSISSVLGGGSISKDFRVIGFFQTNLPRYDSKYAVVSLDAARPYMHDYDPSLDEEHYVTGVAMNFPDPEMIRSFKKFEHPQFQVNTWIDVNQSLLFALDLERICMGAVLSLIVLVGAFSVSGTLMMTVYHSRSQIALLRALGLCRQDIIFIYMIHGAVIGGSGAFMGTFLGFMICLFMLALHGDTLPWVVPHDAILPVEILPFDSVVIGVLAMILTLCAACYPALVASRQDPGKGLRIF
ncbi:MAG: ABC transporter permease [Oligoflexales bacterium]